MKRKVPDLELMAKLSLEALRGMKKINEIGQEYGLHPAQIEQWKKAIQKQAAHLFEGPGRFRSRSRQS